MEFPEKVALVASMAFFGLGLVGGLWKYVAIRRSPEAQAPVYVDVFHRSTLLYGFACLLLERMVAVSALDHHVELAALAALIGFFAFAVVGYAVHGWLADTDNQLRPPYRLGRGTLPPAVVHGSMIALVAFEIGGFAVLAAGVLMSLGG